MAPVRFHGTSGPRGRGCIYRTARFYFYRKYRSRCLRTNCVFDFFLFSPRPPSSSAKLHKAALRRFALNEQPRSLAFPLSLLLLLVLFDSLSSFFLSFVSSTTNLSRTPPRLEEKKQRSTALIKISRNILSLVVPTYRFNPRRRDTSTLFPSLTVFRIRSNDIPKLKQRHPRFMQVSFSLSLSLLSFVSYFEVLFF